MAYEITQNAIVQIQILGRLHGQRTRNTFHYRYTGITPLAGVDTLTAMLDEFEEQVLDEMLNVQSAEFKAEAIQAQLIRPVRHRAVVSNVNKDGLVVGSSLPSSSTVVMRRFAETSGRRFQGRIFVPGVPVSAEEDSRIDPDQIALWDVPASRLTEPLEGGTQTEPFVPVVAIRNPVSVLDDVAGYSLDPILRVQRRRELAVGE